jgi:hypothetical protein
VIRAILMVLAAVCFFLLVFKVTVGSLPLLPLGLGLWVVAELLYDVGPPLMYGSSRRRAAP